MAASSAPLSPLSLSLSLSISLKPRPQQYLLAAQKPFSPLSPPLPHSRRLYNLNLPEAFTSKANKRWEISAFNSDFSISEAENSQEIVAASGDDGVSTIISSLLLIAFVGLTILTIGVRRNLRLISELVKDVILEGGLLIFSRKFGGFLVCR